MISSRISAAFVVALLLTGAGRPAALTIYAVDTSNNLLRFDSATPGTIQSTTPITGLQSNETIQGIDFRPANTALYALGSSRRLYTLNTISGVATPVGAAGAFTLNGTAFGFDCDPVSTSIRVASNTEQNFRLKASDGSLIATDSTLAYAAGDPNSGANPNITGAAYTTSVFAARITTLYTIDATLNILATLDPPNAGTLHTVGPLGVNPGFLVGFDIASASGSNKAFATMRGQ
jgi:hypothetical protein